MFRCKSCRQTLDTCCVYEKDCHSAIYVILLFWPVLREPHLASAKIIGNIWSTPHISCFTFCSCYQAKWTWMTLCQWLVWTFRPELAATLSLASRGFRFNWHGSLRRSINPSSSWAVCTNLGRQSLSFSLSVPVAPFSYLTVPVSFPLPHKEGVCRLGTSADLAACSRAGRLS